MECCSCCCPPDPQSEELLSPRERKSDGSSERSRGCTDCFCLLVFSATLLGASIIARAAFRVGDPERLTNGVDYTGALCGLGEHAARCVVFSSLSSIISSPL